MNTVMKQPTIKADKQKPNFIFSPVKASWACRHCWLNGPTNRGSLCQIKQALLSLSSTPASHNILKFDEYLKASFTARIRKNAIFASQFEQARETAERVGGMVV
ncbi:MAG: hypothetical protein ACI87E_004135 [Mariniblastus sp.]|jgi:hypothetical protein